MDPTFVRLQLAALFTGSLIATGECCSAVIGYRLPTNYELVQQADVIVVAEAISLQVKVKRKGVSYGTFKFKVIEKIKGAFDREFISAEGDTDLRAWGDPNDFSYRKPGRGPCHATDYRRGAKYVLFMEKWRGEWIVSGPPFTRINVLVDDPDAPWAQAVRRYAQVVALGDYEQEKAALWELRARAERGEPGCPHALAADIDRHFAKPTSAKSFADLKALFDAAPDDAVREDVLWALANGKKAAAKMLVEEVMRKGGWEPFDSALFACVRELQVTACRDQLADLFLHAAPGYRRRTMLFALQRICGGEEASLMLKILARANGDEFEDLGQWFIEHPSEEGVAAYRARLAGDYVAKWGPALALAAMGDRKIVEWAREFVQKPGEKQWVGFYVFGCSPLPAADALAREVIRRGDSKALVALVQSYRDSANPHRWERLQDVISVKPKGKKLRYWLRRTLADLAYDGHEQAKDLLNQLPPPLPDEEEGGRS